MTVVSSAYCASLIDFPGSISIPFILFEFLIAFPRISIPIKKSKPESGQPCLTPLFNEKCSLAKPLLRTQLDMSL